MTVFDLEHSPWAWRRRSLAFAVALKMRASNPFALSLLVSDVAAIN